MRGLLVLIQLVIWLSGTDTAEAWAASGARHSALLFEDPAPYPPPELPPTYAQLADGSSARLLLPDLQTLPPSDLEIVTLHDGSRELRLSNMIWNSGSGPLELEGISSRSTRQTRVVQHIHAQVGIGHDHLVGEFIFHPTHEHWHFEDFTLYELWTLTPAGGLKTVVSSSDKLSYCVIDTDVINPGNQAFSPRRRYYGCGRSLQGLSAGWGDQYKSFLDGQSIQLKGVQNGYFALISTANPEAIVLESNYSNNSARHYLKIWGESLQVISLESYYELECNRIGHC